MATIKSFTDLSQSKTLSKILPLESADMGWFRDNVEVPRMYPKDMMKDSVSITCPCWSLSALLGVIPKHIKDFNVLRIDIGEKDFSIWYDEIGYGVITELPNITMECPIDACVEMILKLKELKLI